MDEGNQLSQPLLNATVLGKGGEKRIGWMAQIRFFCRLLPLAIRSSFETLPKAQRTLGIEFFDSLIQQLSFKAEASTSFEILAKFQFGFVL